MSTIVTDHGNMTHLIMIIQKVMEGSLRFELLRPISDRNPRPQGSGYPISTRASHTRASLVLLRAWGES
jgi:ABC-type uncharacterized transport system permease subunit